MMDKVEQIVQCETLELNNSETYVLTDNRFNTYLVLVFSDLNEA